MTHTPLTPLVFAISLVSASVLAAPTGSTNPVSGSATSKSQGFTESFVSIGANATATQTATATTSGIANVTGAVADNMAEITTKAMQTSEVKATGSFEGTAGPSSLGLFSNAGAFSFSAAEGVATIPSIIFPGNSGNSGSGNDGGGNNGNNGNGNN
jgi:hypothetical protein